MSAEGQDSSIDLYWLPSERAAASCAGMVVCSKPRPRDVNTAAPKTCITARLKCVSKEAGS